MSQFPSVRHISSWGGVCPGNNRSAGKNKSSHTTGGNPWLRAALTECAWAASAKKECFLKEKFWRITTKSGGKKAPAIVAVAHTVGVRSATDRRAVLGKEGDRPKPGPEGSHDPAPSQTVRQTGRHGAFEPAQTADKDCQNKKCETNLSRGRTYPKSEICGQARINFRKNPSFGYFMFALDRVSMEIQPSARTLRSQTTQRKPLLRNFSGSHSSILIGYR
jgi:hypothetical protein